MSTQACPLSNRGPSSTACIPIHFEQYPTEKMVNVASVSTKQYPDPFKTHSWSSDGQCDSKAERSCKQPGLVVEQVFDPALERYDPADGSGPHPLHSFLELYGHDDGWLRWLTAEFFDPTSKVLNAHECISGGENEDLEVFVKAGEHSTVWDGEVHTDNIDRVRMCYSHVDEGWTDKVPGDEGYGDEGYADEECQEEGEHQEALEVHIDFNPEWIRRKFIFINPSLTHRILDSVQPNSNCN